MNEEELQLLSEFHCTMLRLIVANSAEKGGFLGWTVNDLSQNLIKHMTRWVEGDSESEECDKHLLNIANLAFMVWAKRRVVNGM